MIKVLSKFAKLPSNAVVIDTTSGSGDFRELSPFVLSAPPAKKFENLWQFSKVYKQHLDDTDWMTIEWYQWQKLGFDNSRAIRYPMGKGAIPEFTYWNDSKLGYIDARKQLYATEYERNVIKTESFGKLQLLGDKYFQDGKPLILLDYDAYDHVSLGMDLVDVINNPKRKMGHAFVLLMMLEGELGRCIESPTPLTAQ